MPKMFSVASNSSASGRWSSPFLRHCSSSSSSSGKMTAEDRRPSLGLRRGSRVRDTEWHSASCRAPRSSYSHLVQQCEQFRHRLHCTFLYQSKSRGVSPTVAFPAIPTIQISLPPKDSRRTSISSPLRFTRTVSTDSIDSIERQCLRDLRQRLMEAERERRSSMAATATTRPDDERKPLHRQLSTRNSEIADAQQLSPLSALPSLRRVGRSKTDPGNDAEENPQNPHPFIVPSQRNHHSQNSLQRSPPSLPLPNGELKRMESKRSTPDLCLDGVSRNRVLSEAIGLSVYQQKLLAQCWPNILSTGTNGPFATNLYISLCNKNPKAKALMQKANGVAMFSQSGMDCTTMHMKMTIELIDSIIRSLDSSPNALIAYLNEIGQCHRNLKTEGVSAAMWDDFGDSILEGVRKNDLVRKHKELRRAWLAVIAFITDNIKQGQSLFRSSPSSVDIADIRLQ